jgi:nucleoside 2-deoxyribosyltransferase
MSFAPAATGVYDFIRRSVEQLGAPEGVLRLYRADDIADPGKITDQIERAIETASVVVADITGLNPNVMWELGYASAYRKPIVILNQDPDSSPFDLKPVRQVQYDAIPTTTNQKLLLKHLVQALLAAVGDNVPEWLVNARL